MKRDVGYWDGFYIIHRHTGLIFVIEIKKKNYTIIGLTKKSRTALKPVKNFTNV